MHFQRVADFLQEFEKEYETFLLEADIKGWNAWSILKKPIYNYIRNAGIRNGEPIVQLKNDKTAYLITFFKYCFNLIKIIFQKQSSNLFVSFNGNRIDKESNGLYVNPFLDPLIINKIFTDYILIESFEGGKVKSSFIPYDLNSNGNHFFILIIEKFFIKNSGFQKISHDIFTKINQHFISNNEKEIISEDLIFRILKKYYAGLLFHNILLKLLKPKKILVVDGIPSALVGAAKRNNITVFEFQHGIIGSNKFEYIVSEKFKNIKNKMPYANYVCVFGDYFKRLLLNTRFWDEDQILVLGNYSIENRRISQNTNQTILENNKPLKILWTTQPSMHSETLQFVHDLMSLNFPHLIYMKPHPLEKNKNLNEYAKLHNQYPNQIFLLNSQNVMLDSLKNKHILLSYHSTSILEAISLGYPTITLATNQFPLGINSYLEEDYSEVIKVIVNPKNLNAYLQEIALDVQKYYYWKLETERIGDDFYKVDYFNTIKTFENL